MKISQFLPKGVGVLFPEKPYLKTNTPPLPVKKRNPGLHDSNDREEFLASSECIGVILYFGILSITGNSNS